ncbi:unnamed protein product [Schistocephalus solidus]|uniref:Uncharacterized protein n=1 Tax=Schistocephalus solidus TaxID=70667 RepID=A0A183SK57_SCHSO|nr:unnamed protein product [Schistocephalus solidus]
MKLLYASSARSLLSTLLDPLNIIVAVTQEKPFNADLVKPCAAASTLSPPAPPEPGVKTESRPELGKGAGDRHRRSRPWACTTPGSDPGSSTVDFDEVHQKLEDLLAPDDNATVKTQKCKLRKVIHSTTLEVFGHARRQHQDWFDNNDADISNLLAEKNELQKAYMDLRTDATKAAFFRCRHLVQEQPVYQGDGTAAQH